MPYIKPALRIAYDGIYQYATYLDTRPDLVNIKDLAELTLFIVNESPVNKQTARLNYLFTKILLQCFNQSTCQFLTHLFKNYFLKDKCYENFEKADGFLHRLREEFKRRKWNEDHESSMRFIDELFWLIDTEAALFEEDKQQENGDV